MSFSLIQLRLLSGRRSMFSSRVGQHHLPHDTVDLVAIDVDVGEVVVRADLLDLTQRVLQRAPVPQPDVLQRFLIVLRVQRVEAGVGRVRHLVDRVEAEGPSRELDVVRDVRSLAHQLVRPDDEAADVPAEDADDEVGDRRRGDCRTEPGQLRLPPIALTAATTAPSTSANETTSRPVMPMLASV